MGGHWSCPHDKQRRFYHKDISKRMHSEGVNQCQSWREHLPVNSGKKNLKKIVLYWFSTLYLNLGWLYPLERRRKLVKRQKDLYLPERIKKVQVPLKSSPQKIQEVTLIEHEKKLVKEPKTPWNHQRLLIRLLRNYIIKGIWPVLCPDQETLNPSKTTWSLFLIPLRTDRVSRNCPLRNYHDQTKW